MLLSVYHHVPVIMFRSAEALNPTNVRNPCEEKGTNQDAKGDDCGNKIVQHCLFSCSAYRVPLVVIPASGPLQENENALRKGQLQVIDGLDLGPAWFVLRPVVAASVA
jgi:hypothetical protein